MRKKYAQEAFVWSVDLHAAPVAMTTVWIYSLRCAECHDSVTSKIQHDGRVEGGGDTLLDFFCFSRVLHSCAVNVHLSSSSIN
jgi:hypothetical protein